MNKNLGMGTGTKVAAALSLTIIGALMVVGCNVDEDEGEQCDTVAASAYSPPKPAPRIAPRSPVKPPSIPGPARPRAPHVQVVCH